MWATCRDNDLIRISVDNQIGIMCDDYDLSSQLGFLKSRNEFIVNGFRVEVFLGLVDDERPIVVLMVVSRKWWKLVLAPLRAG